MHTKITSLKQLTKQLNNATKDAYKAIGVSLDLPLEELTPYTFWSNESYTRNCITRKPNYELILLCWEPGQETPIHCHGGEECWVYIMEGKIEETHYLFNDNKLEVTNSAELKSGEKSFMTDEIGYHKLINNSSKKAISLHLYMDPIDNCTVYDENENEFTPIYLTYHTYQGILENIEV